MYKVYVKYGGMEYPLHEPLDDDVRIMDPVLTEEIGSAGSFSFQIYRGHPNYDKIRPCKSEVILYQDGEAIFYGRVMKPEQGFDNVVAITCEGELTYLLDSIQRPFSYAGNISNYIGKLLEVHNGQVEAEKQIEKGNIIVTGDNADIERTLTGFSPTLTVLRQLPEEYGGYYRIRHAGGKRYLDYLWDYGGINEQVIRFGENLLDLTKYVDASQIITCLIPQGGRVEYQDELGETQARTVDITSVNGGKDYIEDTVAIEQYGRIWGTQTFQDVTDPQKLLEKGRAYLEEAAALPETMEISAVDLSLIDTGVTAFHLGYWTNVFSAPHGIEQRFLLSKREINLLDPTQGSITLGRKVDTLTGNANKSQAAISRRVNQIADETYEEMARKIANATLLITGGLGGYVVLDDVDPVTGRRGHPWRILIMNTPDKATAKNVIQINQNGIGFSMAGIQGPYRNAWTIDGNFMADFITTGSTLADRIRGGTLEIGGIGLGKDGSIIVMDASGNRIGSWDKTGLAILRGILQGVSAIFGGLDNQNGAIEVLDSNGHRIGRWDKNGIIINRGSIEVGPLVADDSGVAIGDYYVSANGSNIFSSMDGTISIQDQRGGPHGSFAALTIGNTMVSDHHIVTQDIRVNTQYWGGSGYNGYVGQALDAIWTGHSWSLEELAARVSALEGR
ncbi:MAG: phage tail protein [Enterocloster asparagiformis]|nr:phage tail protein [Enterocloster asparagiformis]